VRPGRLVYDQAGYPRVVESLVPYVGNEPWFTVRFVDGTEEEWKAEADIKLVQLSLAQRLALRAVAEGFVAMVYSPEPRSRKMYRLAAPCDGRTVRRLTELGLITLTKQTKKYLPFQLTTAGAELVKQPLGG
jgi:hypothetical protein